MKPSRVLVSFALTLAAAYLLGQAPAATPATLPATTPYPVTITIDAAHPSGPLNPIWRWEGYDEPNYTYLPNGTKLVHEFADAATTQGPAYFRTHYLLCTGDGTPRLKWGSTNAYTEDADSKPIYDFTIVDKIFDVYVKAGAKPYAQIGMMPKALSSHSDPYEPTWRVNGGSLFAGWAYPPKDYDKWRELVFQWAKHCVDRYGLKEVESWYWEVWNEANIGYWKGSPEEFQKLYDYAADGLKRAVPNARVGGAETAGPGDKFQTNFLTHCLDGTNFATGKKGSPLDSFSFHAKGSPSLNRDGEPHVRMGVANQLRDINSGFQIAAARPETKKLPIIIGESDPDGCAGCPAAGTLNPQYGYRNSALFAVYTIEQLTRTLDLADRHGVNLKGSVTWAFEFEDQPLFAGFRALATDGLDLPVLHVYRMLGKMGAQRLVVSSTGDVGLDSIMRNGVRDGLQNGVRVPTLPDVHALAARDDRRVTVIAWNYHDDDLPGPVAAIYLAINGLPAHVLTATLTEWRIDADHSNVYAAWKTMASPAKPTAEQRVKLEEAATLATLHGPVPQPLTAGSAKIHIDLPRQGVSLLELSW